MRRFRNKSTDFATAEKMCFNYFSSSVKTLVSLWMFSCLFDIALGQCRGEADIICKDIGSADEHRNALISAFSGNHEIDLIFIICNTTYCTKAYSKVISFIVNLVALVSTKCDSYIDADRLHIAMIVYDNTSARVTLNDIKETIPKVGNCEFDKFLNNSMASYEARGTTDGLLTESLKEANTVFSQSARSKARKILWLFSDCRCCVAAVCENDKRQEVKNAVGDIKRGNLNNVFVFTGGITPCPVGWFHTLSQEDTMKTIATNNASHYACIDKWIDFAYAEINSDVDECSRTPPICGAEAVNCSNTYGSYICHCRNGDAIRNGTCITMASETKAATIIGAVVGSACGLLVIVAIIVAIVCYRRKRCEIPPPEVASNQPNVKGTEPELQYSSLVQTLDQPNMVYEKLNVDTYEVDIRAQPES